MTIARVDCPAGASGNMFLGALLDAGLDQAELEAELRTLDLPPWRLVRQAVRKGPIAATHMDFEIDAAGGHQTLSNPESMAAVIAASGVREPARTRAQRMVRRLAEAEAAVHGVEPGDVHFHELGAVDAVLDIVGRVRGRGPTRHHCHEHLGDQYGQRHRQHVPRCSSGSGTGDTANS